MIQAWASQKSFRPKDGSVTHTKILFGDDNTLWIGSSYCANVATVRTFVGRNGRTRPSQSTTDPESRLYKKSYGKESKLAYLGRALVENRNGLIAAAMATQADGHAQRDAALLLLDERQKHSSKRITAGADKAHNAKNFVAGVRALNVTAHVQKNETGRRSNLG